ncbi:hypothetical protein DLM78_15330 [Leptospira stimsonii]|uniref:Uncharacterized protein n=1 Tax=Leptospira stimsonii TaxID=2202203 RepID=A0A8B3CMW9_9LEPT|nr:hypothetical protein DLM78_15330 [Leptospira stimsonii]
MIDGILIRDRDPFPKLFFKRTENVSDREIRIHKRRRENWLAKTATVSRFFIREESILKIFDPEFV